MERRPGRSLAGLLLLLLQPLSEASECAAARYTPSVVVVTTFADEYQRWRERLPLKEQLPFPAGAGGFPLGWNPALKVLGVVTGMGPKNAALSMTALGHDPRFNLTSAYWVLAGIGGFDPRQGTVGSAAWLRYIVDGDFAKFIDPREMPRDWPTGWVPWVRNEPYGLPRPSPQESDSMVIPVESDLVAWAWKLTQQIELPDSAALRKRREPYGAAFPAATAPPRVQLGDTLSTNAFWGGGIATGWARNWTRYWSGGNATFVTAAMEDFAVAEALRRLAAAGRTRHPRGGMLALRAASNFCEPPPGQTAEDQMREEVYPTEAYEAAYNVASRAVLALAEVAQPTELYSTAELYY